MFELLCQHWGFYFNASVDDWGSGDMMRLFDSVDVYLNDAKAQASTTALNFESNNIFARKATLLLFLSRLLVFKYCLGVPGCAKTFTSARWTLLQVCPYILFKDIFNTLFRKVLKLQGYGENEIVDLVSEEFEAAKDCIIKHGCLPKINPKTRLLVVNDEAQFLGNRFQGSFQSESESNDVLRPLLSPILHGFERVDAELTLVSCGTGLSIDALSWVQSTGSGQKNGSNNFEHIEFPGWTDLESIKAYIARVRRCLPDPISQEFFDGRFPPAALDMLFNTFAGHYRHAIVAIQKIVGDSEPDTWKKQIEGIEVLLVDWNFKDRKGNLCNELIRLHRKHEDARRDKSVKTVLEILSNFYRRCFWGENTLEDSVNASLVERAFGRIKIINKKAITAVDEPFVYKALDNFTKMDPGFKTELQDLMAFKSTASAQGNIFEQYMINLFSEAFKSRSLSDWPHEPPISLMCPDLVGKVEIVGWRKTFMQGTTHTMLSMEEFMDAHVNHSSTHRNNPVAPFFFPSPQPSGPDLVFFIRCNDRKMVPVFVQIKLHQSSSTLSKQGWEQALATVSAPCIETHVTDFRKFCPSNIYISMIIAYPIRCSPKLEPVPAPKMDESGVKQMVIRIGDVNFGHIFSKHVNFIDRLKDSRKRAAENVGSDVESDAQGRYKKRRT